ncbi:hypothetical protein COV42_02925 [Candidatus Campbellbacteria bacterium CG11_big_fil_rev_8_21_14_0_20_44_21]|uniref:Type IV secretion system coupling protein TraD DNA-binding domain-containing protein n=1 Tax=Candidatus Campbellbacteria bacterium CG22_combo_CG10-13_8_21_14_all_43_18 TaxID=1974530 RepID=A0A2H0DW65_9BACT|nr:MAG: hypothetical protein COW82_02090 [Candidatus Campbellbacteria bacterium CG22_combo_CG10-13_8_21_14_all_43_18]PIR24002.1 MAG: hypothetical protein COV42_02925 [Candidatus Campbellbacteria bacterium CG11_big_fil_rev_8_21_14_0_20_44_21]
MEGQNKITYFGLTDYRGKQTKFGIKREDRTKHVYVIGKTGMGKSTLLENMAIQDIQNGEGMAFIDPHGKTADLLLDYIPEERIDDILYIAPFDMENPVSFNVMEDVGPDKRHLVANGLMSAFKKIWVDAWSARMEYILNNIMLALLEYPDSTLVGVNRMLADKAYRKKVVANVTDVSVKAFWEEEFAKYSDRFMVEAGAAIQNKVGQFISNPLVRNIIGQPKSSFDIREMMDKKKIIIINLSKGLVGEANANLLGSMLITKIYLGAMSRADVSLLQMQKLPNFYLYVDEFQSFANESFADILSEARKYKLNLTIAHQYIEQMSEEVREAVFGNVGTFITFRVGAYDGEVLEKELAPEFTIEDLVNLGKYQMYLKLMIDGVGSRPFSAVGLAPFPPPRVSYKDMIIDRSRKQFSKPRAIVEEELIRWHQTGIHGAAALDGERKTRSSQDKEKMFPQKALVSAENVSHREIPQRQVLQTPEILKKGMFGISDREKKLQEVVSLGRLRAKKRKKHKTSPQNVNELRKALSTVLKDVHARHPESAEKMRSEKKTFQPKPFSSELKRDNVPKPVEVGSQTEGTSKKETEAKKELAGEEKIFKKSAEVPTDILKRVFDAT